MEAPESSRPARVVGYDIMRVIAIIAVVSIHVLMVYRESGSGHTFAAVVDATLHFAVPVFFFISGALVWGRARTHELAEHGGFLARRARGILAPYFAWSVLYLVVSAVRGDALHVLGRSPALLLWGRAWYHLYFVPAIMLFYALTPILAPVVRRRPEAALAVAYLIRVIAAVFLFPPLTSRADPLFCSFVVTVISHLSDVVLGTWFATRADVLLPRLKRWSPLLLGAGTVLIGAGALPGQPWGVPSFIAQLGVPLGMALDVLGVAGLAFRMRLGDHDARTMAHLGTLTFGVYLVHPAIVLAWNATVEALGLSSLWRQAWFPAITVLVVAAGSLAISSALASRPSTAWLVGVRSAGATLRRRLPLPMAEPEVARADRNAALVD